MDNTAPTTTTIPPPPGKFHVAAHTRGEIWGVAPMIRDTGDFTVNFTTPPGSSTTCGSTSRTPPPSGGCEDREVELP